MILCYSSPSNLLNYPPLYHLLIAHTLYSPHSPHALQAPERNIPQFLFLDPQLPSKEWQEHLSSESQGIWPCPRYREVWENAHLAFLLLQHFIEAHKVWNSPSTEGTQMPGHQKERQMSNIIDFIVMNFKGHIIFHYVDVITKNLFPC